MKKKLEPELLFRRWLKAADGLISDSPSPTPKDLHIVGLLAYMMDITPIELIKFLTGMKPTLKSLKQIKQWLDFREQFIREEELPENIRERHRLVNANYGRIVEELDRKEKDGSINV